MENQVLENQAVQTVQTQTPKSPFEIALGKSKKTFTDIYGDAAAVKFKQEAGFAYMQAQKNKRILSCSESSIRNALVQVALTDLTLNPHLNYAYLIPRGSECTLDIDYKYMIDLLIKNNIVEAIDTGVIFKGDEFVYKKGTNAIFEHTPDLLRESDKQEDAIAAYAIVFINGHKLPFVLKKSDILSRKNVSKSHGVWNGDFWQSMWIKSVIRYAYKFLPKSQKVDAVMSLLNENDSKEPVKTDTVEITYE